jgi:hypothetical protein
LLLGIVGRNNKTVGIAFAFVDMDVGHGS